MYFFECEWIYSQSEWIEPRRLSVYPANIDTGSKQAYNSLRVLKIKELKSLRGWVKFPTGGMEGG
jgi:hypothetical protein